MAIKVNGTTVINDSRQLQNVASVDATTVAALGAAGVGGGKNNSLVLLQEASGTLTIPMAGDVVFIACGGGGGGAALSWPNNTVASTGTNRYSASGGAAGGVAIKTLTGVSAGSTYTCAIGAGGARSYNIRTRNTDSVGELTSGGNGGQTTITGTGISLTANGGGGGTANGSGNSTSGAGGTASGGDTNITGGTSTTVGKSSNLNDYNATWTGSSGATPSFFTGYTYNGGDALIVSNSYQPGFLEGSPNNPDDDAGFATFQITAPTYYKSKGAATSQKSPIPYQTLVIPSGGTGMVCPSYNNYGSMGISGAFGGGGGCAVAVGGPNYRWSSSGYGGQGFVLAIVFAQR